MRQKLSTTHAASAVVLAACGGLFHECATLQKIVLVAFFITDTGPWYRRQTGCNKSIYLNRFSDSGHLANVCSHSLFTSSDLGFFFLLPFFKRVFFRCSSAYIIQLLFCRLAGNVQRVFLGYLTKNSRLPGLEVMPMSAGNLNGQDVCCETKTRRQRTIKCFIKLKGTGESVILPLPSCSSWRAAAFHMFSKMQMHLVRGELKAKLRHIYGITGARSSFFLFSPLTAVTLSQLILITIKPTHTHTLHASTYICWEYPNE